MLAGKHGVWLRSPALTTGPAATMGRPTRVAVFTRPGTAARHRDRGRAPHAIAAHLSTLVRLRSGDSLVVLENDRISSGPKALAHVPVLLPLGPDTIRLAGSSYRALADAVAGTELDQAGDPLPAAGNRQRRGQGRPPPHARRPRLADPDRPRRLRDRRLDRRLARPPGGCRERDRARPARPAGAGTGRDEFARLGIAFNEMADQLQARMDELDAERARLREATVRFGEALAATHDVDQLLRVIIETVVQATGATAGLVVGLGGEVVQTGTISDRGERFELPLTAGRQSFGTLTLSGRDFSRRAAPHRRVAGRARRGCARKCAAAPDRHAPGPRRHAHRPREPPPVRGRPRRRAPSRGALRRLGRLRPRRPRQLQVDQRPLRPSSGGHRPRRVRRHAARVRPRDRRARPLGRRGVRDRAPGHRPRRRVPARRAGPHGARAADDPRAGRDEDPGDRQPRASQPSRRAPAPRTSSRPPTARSTRQNVPERTR